MTHPRPGQAVLAALVLLLIIGSVLPLASYRPWFWMPLSVACALLFAISMAMDLRHASGSNRIFRQIAVPALLFGLVVLWGWIQTLDGLPRFLWNPAFDRIDAPGRITLDRDLSRQFLLRLISYGMIFLLVARLARNEILARVFLISAGLFGTFYIAAALALYGAGINDIFGVARQSRLSAGATIESPNAFGHYAGMLALTALCWILCMTGRNRRSDRIEARDRKNRPEILRIILLVGVILAVPAVALTYSRAALGLMILGGLSIYGFLQLRHSIRNMLVPPMFLGLILAIPLATLMIAWSFDPSVDGENEHLLQARARLFSTAIDVALNSPWQGTGLGTFTIAASPFKDAALSRFRLEAAHNIYLEHLIELGPVAALLLWTAMILIARRIFVGLVQCQHGMVYPLVGVTVLVMTGLHNTLDYTMHRPAVVLMFILLTATAWAQSWRHPEQGSDRFGTLTVA